MTTPRLLLRGDTVEAHRRRRSALHAGIERVDADGGMLVPGFVDLQVNGGGGVMLNDRPRCRHDPHDLRARTRRSARRRCCRR